MSTPNVGATGGASNAQSTQSLTPAEATAAGKAGMEEKMATLGEMMKKLGPVRSDRIESKVNEAVAQYIKDHPNASAEEIKKFAGDQVSTRTSGEFMQKLQNDYFMGKIMARGKELMQDLWE